MKNDLRTISELNNIFKYADDTTLLVPEHTNVDLNSEFNHIKHWVATNGLIINSNKTKEVVFRQPRVSCFHLPAAIDDTEQVDCCKLLCVMFQNNCKMDSHVQIQSIKTHFYSAICREHSVFTYLNCCSDKECLVTY